MRTNLQILTLFGVLFAWSNGQSILAATTARLVSEWKFENDPNDTSGSANNGTITGSPTYVTGRFGQGIYLNRPDSIQKTGAANLPVLAADSWSCNQWLYLTNAPDSLACFAGFGNPASTGGAGTARSLIAFENPDARGIYS